jgi:hypothetical protein
MSFLAPFTCSHCNAPLKSGAHMEAAIVCTTDAARLCTPCLLNLNSSVQYHAGVHGRRCPLHRVSACAPARSVYHTFVSRVVDPAAASAHLVAVARHDHAAFVAKWPYGQVVCCPACGVVASLNYNHVPCWSLIKCGSCHSVFCSKCVTWLPDKHVSSHYFYVQNSHGSAWMTCDNDPCCKPNASELVFEMRRLVEKFCAWGKPHEFASEEAKAVALAAVDSDPCIVEALKALLQSGVECSVPDGTPLDFNGTLTDCVMLLDWLEMCTAQGGLELQLQVLTLWFMLIPRNIAGQAVGTHPYWSVVVCNDPVLSLLSMLVQ